MVRLIDDVVATLDGEAEDTTETSYETEKFKNDVSRRTETKIPMF